MQRSSDACPENTVLQRRFAGRGLLLSLGVAAVASAQAAQASRDPADAGYLSYLNGGNVASGTALSFLQQSWQRSNTWEN